MAKRLNPAQKKELRGQILLFLYDIHPYESSQESVAETYYEYWEYDDIIQALEYLCGKGYVQKREIVSPLGGFEKIRKYVITPTGIDLCDQTTDDNGVYVRR